ncbi:exodeoxyribonuclease V subunit beta [Ramlibacter sp. RBP-2]|uniref:RecBCD enzyme subunit RecB n=1 Tax=Ramlibacter lithotrophicus TaxID=2606681 RepID=A0A7X6DCU7_9BURK|nr:exodeoxyribonuclease V subunit beta [Ramlibacter lithotrophicus]NKE64844.1 exodeoxyribonuclease V subunit beta [Ramlibacter lithotrophicus]
MSGRRPEALDVFRCPLQGVRLIEASAGTGKTWNICGLYLRLLVERGLEVQEILVVTFTNAATAELRERVRERITQVLARLEGRGPESADPFVAGLLAALRDKGFEDEALARLLTRAARNFDEAAIFTIHGFCKRALDDTPFAAGLPLAQEMIEDDGELRQEVANDFWRREVAGGAVPPELAAYLLECKESPARFAELLQRHCGKPLSRVIWPDGSGDGMPRIDGTALRAAHANARAIWRTGREKVIACVTEALPRLNGNRYKETSVAAAVEQWDEVLASGDANDRPPVGEKLVLFTPGCLKPKAKHAPCGEHDFFAAAQALLDEWSALRERLERARMVLWRKVAEEGPVALRARKRERRVVAFDDMLFNLHERLHDGRGAGLAVTLRERFPAALIDEFQDTDPLQFAIFDAVYGAADGPLFLVGDPKQAIYSFRNADLHTYLQARSRAGAQYTLAENQRSTPALLDGLNALFEANERAFMLDGLDYHSVRAGAKPRTPLVDGTEARAALQLWRLPPDQDEDGPIDKTDARARAARATAGEIARLLAAARRGEIRYGDRPLESRDIAVLVRSRAEGSLVRAELKWLGVGSVELAQTSVFESADAQELERILVAVLEPGREPLLRAALATELLGCTAPEIDGLSSDEQAVLRRMGQFAGYRDTWLHHGIARMLRQLFAAEGVAARMLRRGDGERRLTNLRHLAECLNEAARDHPGAEALLRWLQRQRREHEGGEATQVRLESDRNLVQIFTIHRSKGLEYPIVFCPFLWDGSPGGGRGAAIPRDYHDDAGRPVIDYRDVGDDTEVKRRMKMEADAERLRLIYVALTRAVHRCYLVVGSYSVAAFGRPSTAECSGNPLNWLAAGDGIPPEAWRDRKTPAERIVDAWSTLAGKSPHIAIEVLPGAQPVPVEIPRPAADSLAARPPPGRIPPGWWIGSYSGLAHGAKSEAAADHDVRVQDARPLPLSGERGGEGAPDILHFPRGARAGESLHAVFERVDFGDPQDWPAAVAHALRIRPPQAGAAESAAWQAMVLQMLADVTATKLPAGHRLADVARARRLVELEFSLPSAGLESQALAATLRRHGYPVSGFAFGRLDGYLRGFIDLVYEHHGRWHLLDWKSNHLGWRAADYHGANLRRAMDEQGYHLQYLLYTVALHRYLKQRLRGYDYERHFGGAQYLFVRGVRPGWTQGDGSAGGVFFDRPEREAIEALDALLGHREGASA